MSLDTIGNFLTVIRNGVKVARFAVETPFSKINHQIALILKDEGFIRDIVVEGEDHNKKLRLLLKYVDGESVIHEIVRVSTPGRRAYKGIASLQPVIGNLGISILTTNQGVISNKKAEKLGVGGEVICTVW